MPVYAFGENNSFDTLSGLLPNSPFRRMQAWMLKAWGEQGAPAAPAVACFVCRGVPPPRRINLDRQGGAVACALQWLPGLRPLRELALGRPRIIL